MGISSIAMAKGNSSRRDTRTTVVAEELVKQHMGWCFAFAIAIATSYFANASVVQSREGGLGKVFRNLSDDLSLLFASGSAERELGQIDRVLDHLEVSSRIDHASIVIGRRWSDAKGEQCLYQIKNSFGKDCSKYSSEHECKDGVLWVRESHLRGMIGELSWLE